jgi:hypothetical protein
LVEIKNPKTGYGRRGLNPIQKQWIERWNGGPIYIIKSLDDAEQFARGRFDEVEVVKSGWVEETVQGNQYLGVAWSTFSNCKWNRDSTDTALPVGSLSRQIDWLRAGIPANRNARASSERRSVSFNAW